MWKICPRQPALFLFFVLFLLVALLSCSLLTLRPKLEQIKLARFAIHIRKAQSKSATPPRGRHLSIICSSHSPAHHPKCKSCASETFAPLHLINATSCSIKQRDASPPFSSFQKKGFRQQTALAMPGHHALAQTAHSSHLLRPLTALDHRIQHWSETNSQRRRESRH